MSSAAPKSKTPEPPGKRERNKLSKQTRIISVARRLFVERGYDNTTVRRIGHDADVGLGTVFAEVADKRALLFLCFNAELQTVLDGAMKRSSAT